jgi:anti-anti-sigma regulatory factor
VTSRPAPRSDHRCVAYGSPDESLRFVQRWFAATTAAPHERAVYVASGPEDPALDWLRSTPEGARVRVGYVEDVYGGRVADAAAIVGEFRRMAAEARAEGATTIRAAADLTPVAVDRSRFEPLVNYELAIDEVITAEGLHGACLYDAAALGEHSRTLACVHDHGERYAGFRLTRHGDRLHVVGEIDPYGAAAFATVLASADPVPATVDLEGLSFLDAAGARPLADYVRDRAADGRPVRLVGAGATVRLVLDAFDVSAN